MPFAITLPVADPLDDSQPIKEWSTLTDSTEIILNLAEGMEGTCTASDSQRVTVEGYLFHAHTAHHHTTILMDVRHILF